MKVVVIRPDLHEKVDSTHLIHELHAVCEQHTAPCLNLISLKHISPPELAMLLLERHGLQNICLLALNSRIVLRSVIDLAKYLHCFIVSIVIEEPSCTLWDAKHKEDGELYQSACNQAAKTYPRMRRMPDRRSELSTILDRRQIPCHSRRNS